MAKPKKTDRQLVDARQDKDVLLASIAVKHTWAKSARLLLGLVGLAIVMLASWPVAREFAGEETVLNVSIAVGLTVSLTLAGTGIAAWGNSHRRRADRLQVRNDRLSRNVKELQRRLREAGKSDEIED